MKSKVLALAFVLLLVLGAPAAARAGQPAPTPQSQGYTAADGFACHAQLGPGGLTLHCTNAQGRSESLTWPAESEGVRQAFVLGRTVRLAWQDGKMWIQLDEVMA